MIHICWKGREVCGLVIAVNVKILQSSLYHNHHSQSFSAQKGNKTFFIGLLPYFQHFLINTHTTNVSVQSSARHKSHQKWENQIQEQTKAEPEGVVFSEA